MISEIISNGSISADWVFGIIVSILGFLIWQNLRDVKEIIKKHETDINELKLSKANSDDVEEFKQRNTETIREFDAAVAEVSKNLDVMAAKLAIINKT